MISCDGSIQVQDLAFSREGEDGFKLCSSHRSLVTDTLTCFPGTLCSSTAGGSNSSTPVGASPPTSLAPPTGFTPPVGSSPPSSDLSPPAFGTTPPSGFGPPAGSGFEPPAGGFGSPPGFGPPGSFNGTGSFGPSGTLNPYGGAHGAMSSSAGLTALSAVAVAVLLMSMDAM